MESVSLFFNIRVVKVKERLQVRRTEDSLVLWDPLHFYSIPHRFVRKLKAKTLLLLLIPFVSQASLSSNTLCGRTCISVALFRYSTLQQTFTHSKTRFIHWWLPCEVPTFWVQYLAWGYFDMQPVERPCDDVISAVTFMC